MNCIERYSFVKANKIVAEKHLRLLLDKRLELYVKYCGVKSVPTDKEIHNSQSNDSRVVAFLEAYEIKKNSEGKSLSEQIIDCNKEIMLYKRQMEQMEKVIHELSNNAQCGCSKEIIVYRLYSKIVLDGLKPTQAVKELTTEFGFSDERSIWKTYYPEVKKYLNILKKTA